MPDALLLHGPDHGSHVRYEPFNGWLVPWRFSSFSEEYGALRRSAGLIDYSTQALIEVAGADRLEWLQRLLTNDVKRLTPGAGCRAALLTSTAKVIADLLVLADRQAIWLLCDAHRAAALARALQSYLFSEEVRLINHERSVCVLALEGPKALESLPALFGAATALPRRHDHCVVSSQGLDVRLINYSLTGSSGILCWCDAVHAPSVWKRLRASGRSLGLIVVGWEALNTARIEAGLPWSGLDLNESNLLPETGLETLLVSETKGCYVGQEIVARMTTYGSANKKLMGLRIQGKETPRPGDPLYRGDEAVGHVTSACFSPLLEQPIALGYVKRGAYDVGTSLEAVRGVSRLRAVVTRLDKIGYVSHFSAAGE